MARLYLDADVDLLVARRLAPEGYDIVAARDVGMRLASDPEQLAYAAREGYTLFTYNIRDFTVLHMQYLQEGRTHAGILVSRQYQRGEIGPLLRLLRNAFALATETDFPNQVRYLSEFDV